MRRITIALAILLIPFAALMPKEPDAPVSPREAPLKMTLPDGFKATLFAGEPDVVQPIAFTFDDRGRVWVAECFTYPGWDKNPKDVKDRVTIFEDADGDGQFDKRTVFHSKLRNVSGIAYGFGGVWLCATPNLLFIPDRNGDDVPDGEPQIILDGWDLKAQHNVFNGLTWGPDGWLYGCNGILSNSKVGAPGTPDKDRVALNCGVWRYHPITKKFEAVAHGTTNPWGLDFDDYGEMFITNCVIHHLWHVVPGAHLQRMFGQDINPHSYGLMESIADHIHWAGGHWTSSRGGAGAHSDAGGGHAHSGAMIYLGDNWPARYRNGAFMCNIHGNRVNHDLLERRGSTYVARHGKDFLFANDPWFRGLALQYGPDGGVYVADWTDTGECHNYKVADKTNGRIYKVTYGKPAPFREDMAKLSDMDLVKRQLHANDWHVRHARRLLQERAAARKLDPNARLGLKLMLEMQTEERKSLRAIWALHAVGDLDERMLIDLMHDGGEHELAWALRLGMDGKPGDAFLGECIQLARKTSSPLVRLYLASALQRIPGRIADWEDTFWAVAKQLVRRQDDAQDLYLPLMIWYGIEPQVARDTKRGLELLAETKIPLVREYIARRLVALNDEKVLDKLLAQVRATDDPPLHRDVLRGVQEGLSGRRDMPMPPNWKTAYPTLVESPLTEVRERTLSLAVLFGDDRAWNTLRKTVLDRKQAAASRQFALQTMVFKHKDELVPVLQELLDDPALRSPAIRGLATFNDPATPALLLKRYAKFGDAEKADALQALASRPAYALALLDAVAKDALPRRDVSAFTIRQLTTLKSKDVTERVEKVWGKTRPPSQEKAALMGKFKGQLSASALKNANLANGRALYAKHCASCHKLFGEGGDVGPELTGSQRANLDYVLENVLDPSAIVPREYQVTVVVTTNGRVVNGIVKKETEQAVTLQAQNEQVTIPKGEIESRMQTNQSLMPDNILAPLRNDEVRDLIGYLASPAQVPLPGEGKK